jgi:hypothetical protein
MGILSVHSLMPHSSISFLLRSVTDDTLHIIVSFNFSNHSYTQCALIRAARWKATDIGPCFLLQGHDLLSIRELQRALKICN